MMKRIAIYGLGERFRAFFCMDGSSDLIKRLKKSDYEIVGCMDANASMREVGLDNEMIPVVQKEEWKDFSIDYVVVTSDKYFEEIKCELIDCGFKEEQILDLFSFWGSVIYKKIFGGGNGAELKLEGRQIFLKGFISVANLATVSTFRKTLYGGKRMRMDMNIKGKCLDKCIFQMLPICLQ